jgi:hypothetical protein
MKNKAKLPFLRTENLVVKELSSELLVYDLETNKAYCLNETARLILDECNGTNSIDEAVDSLNHKLKTNVNEEIIWMMIEQFKKSNFLKGDYEVPIQTSKVSRRKMLQTAASLGIALPIVASLVAPVATHAQSCPGVQQTCSNNEVNPIPCCQGLQCINTESGPTGFTCFGCIPAGSFCTLGGTPCCNGGSCISVQGALICQVIG